ncbi:hypothetical protein [Lactiplantibacillus pentosus]|jgi:hypothetical protein|nr:hypothetical protein [Lactiplantibacillus pentosus]MCB5220337.1 hypothetical protein [Lactiplantibacillus pentosus]MDC6396937.1 hypothetical protein [Lactiplantibacillus pentosus]
MNQTILNSFPELTSTEQIEVLGGDWPGQGFIKGIYDVGYKTGKALAKWF